MSLEGESDSDITKVMSLDDITKRPSSVDRLGRDVHLQEDREQQKEDQEVKEGGQGQGDGREGEARD